MKIIIRRLAVQDSAVVAELTRQLGYRTTAAATAELITEFQNSTADLTLVAEINKQVVGWIHAFYAVRLESGRFVEIGGLVVAEQHRSKGIGNRLLAEVKEWSLQRQASQIKVRCNIKRLASHQFYLKAGFTETKEQKIFGLAI